MSRLAAAYATGAATFSVAVSDGAVEPIAAGLRGDNPAALMVLARAEKRLPAMIARRGIDADVIATCAVYERWYLDAARGANAPRTAPSEDVLALVRATQDADAETTLTVLDRTLGLSR